MLSLKTTQPPSSIIKCISPGMEGAEERWHAPSPLEASTTARIVITILVCHVPPFQNPAVHVVSTDLIKAFQCDTYNYLETSTIYF